MAKISVNYHFMLSDGKVKILTINDLREDIEPAEILAFSDLLIAKNSVIGQVPIASLMKCVKNTLDQEVIK
ncbi:MAG: DUF2922 domain-containing protein [Oscillospiraceae bacterium]|nr:DUF2922 domain-containing protein [Oscillospiraceae bacterium]